MRNSNDAILICFWSFFHCLRTV